MLVEYILNHLVLLAFFYTNYFYLIPVILKRKGIGKYIVWALISFALTFIIQNLVELLVLHHQKISFKSLVGMVQLYAISTSFRMLIDSIHEARRKKILEHEKMTIELAFLRSQINPHFLFNTLNNINSLIGSNPPAAQKSIVRLSTIMRYMLNTATQEKITLEKEIEYIGNYIELQRLRLPTGFDIKYESNVGHSQVLIEPLLLIGFIENTFKHALADRPSDFIHLKIQLHDRTLILETTNSAPIVKTNLADSGIGIANIKKRLVTQYENKHELEIKKENEVFYVRLRLEL